MRLRYSKAHMDLPQKIVQLRKEKGWTQAIAAKKIGIQQSYLSKLENGHYQPSVEVIQKLCSTYSIEIDGLVSLKKSKYQFLKLWQLYTFLLFGVCIFSAGYFSLIYPKTFYTYKANLLDDESSKQLQLSYHLSDEYLGDVYVSTLAGNVYKYELITEKKISRIENRRLITAGLVIIFIALAYFLYSQRVMNLLSTSSKP